MMTMDERVKLHKNDYDKGDTRKLFQFIRSNGGWGLVTVSEVESFASIDKETLRQKEQTHIDLDNPLCLNTLRAYVNVKEAVKCYYDAHRESIDAYKLEWGRKKRQQIYADPVKHAEYKARVAAVQRAYRAKKKAMSSPAGGAGL